MGFWSGVSNAVGDAVDWVGDKFDDDDDDSASEDKKLPKNDSPVYGAPPPEPKDKRPEASSDNGFQGRRSQPTPGSDVPGGNPSSPTELSPEQKALADFALVEGPDSSQQTPRTSVGDGPPNGATPILTGPTQTYSSDNVPGVSTTVAPDVGGLAVPQGRTGNSAPKYQAPEGIGVLGQMALEMAPPGSRFEGRKNYGLDGSTTTEWRLVVPGQEPTAWWSETRTPNDNGTSTEVTYGSDGKPNAVAVNPRHIGTLGELVLEMAPPGTKFEGQTTTGADGSTTTAWNVLVPGQEPAYWGKTQHFPLSDGTSIDVNYGSDGNPLLAKGEGSPAAKLALPDDNGSSRWAVLNTRGEYLYTIDGAGRKVIVDGTDLTTLSPEITQADLGGSNTNFALLGTALLANVGRGAATGGTVGTAGSPLGSAVGAGLGVVVGLGLTWYMYERGDFSREPWPWADPGSEADVIDPNSIPVIPPLKPAPMPGEVDVPPVDDGVTADPSVGPEGPVDAAPLESDAPPVTRPTRPTPADDPNTTHQPILFPSAVDGQPGVPVEGTYWQGNNLVWAEGNPSGGVPGRYAGNPNTKTDLNLKAFLYKLLDSNLDDIDEEHRPPFMAALAVVHGALLYQQTFRNALETLAVPYGADVDKLTGRRDERETELQALKNRRAPVDLFEQAIEAWSKAETPVNRAKELLGEAGAIAMLRSDGWKVNPRPKGGYTHDIVAVKNGQVMVIEAKGGNPGPPRIGNAEVFAGPDSNANIRATQMTDPYLWHKLKEDAAKDPEFKQWLVDHGAWTAIENEDASKVGYRLVKVDTNGKISVYGSRQIPKGDGIPADTVIGQTTGQGGGPTLRGVAEPLGQVSSIVPEWGPRDGLLSATGSWIEGLIQSAMSTVIPMSQLVPVPFLPVSPPPRAEALTVNIVQHADLKGPSSDTEWLNCLTYL